MTKQERVIIFIDGGNFHHLVLETMFHYSDIQKVLVESDLKKFIK